MSKLELARSRKQPEAGAPSERLQRSSELSAFVAWQDPAVGPFVYGAEVRPLPTFQERLEPHEPQKAAALIKELLLFQLADQPEGAHDGHVRGFRQSRRVAVLAAGNGLRQEFASVNVRREQDLQHPLVEVREQVNSRLRRAAHPRP